MTANHRPLEEGDIELIDRVRDTPCLYDTKDPNFRLVYKKEEEWQTIADSLHMPHWEARKRWTALRDRYARELKQMILHPDSMEYGKNDFFLRMDFLRNFVKKREVKRKRCNSQAGAVKDDKPRPLKLYKVDADVDSFETHSNQMITDQKTYIIDDSQDSSTGKFSYIEHTSQDHKVERDEQHVNEYHIDEHCEEQEYHDYVEDTSAAYEAVEEDHDNDSSYLMNSTSSGGNIIIKPENSKMSHDFTLPLEEDKLPHLQQRPVMLNNCLDMASTSAPPIDTEEYFSKTIASYLRQLSPLYKIKAKVEMMKVIEKFIVLNETKS